MTNNWLQPVNGFYRLTRGAYAHFGLPAPYVESAIDTILAHTRINGGFETRNVNACNVLDIVHPLWLCKQQSDFRRAEIDAPGLQGAEMWLAIMYIAADALGWTRELPYTPRGVHWLRPPEDT